MKFLQDLNLSYLSMLPNLLMSADSADLRGAVTDLGGGADTGNEPDIFEGVGDDAGNEADSGDGDGNEAGADDADAGADADDAGSDDAGDEGVDEDVQDADAGGPDAADEADEANLSDEEKQAAIDAKSAEKKPLTDAEKAVEKTLQEAYRSQPKLKEALKQFPELRGEFFKAVEMNKTFPGGIQEAQQAKQWAQDLFKIDQLYYGSGPQDMKSKRDFLNMMYEESLDAQGKSTGHYESLAELISSDMLTNVESQLTAQPQLATSISKELKPAQVATAIEIVRRAVSLLTGRQLPKGPSTQARPSQPVDLGPDTANMTPRERQLAQENADLKAQRDADNRTTAETSESTFRKSIYDTFTAAMKPDLDKRMPGMVKSGGSRVQKAFVDDVLEETRKTLSADDFFDAQLSAVARSGDRGQQHVQKLSDMLKQRAITLLPTIVSKVTAEWQKDRQLPEGGKGQARKGNERPRREPAVGGSPGRLTRPTGGSRPSNRAPAAGNKSSGDYTRDANKLLGID